MTLSEDTNVIEYKFEDHAGADYREPWDYEEPVGDVSDWEHELFLRDVQSKFKVKRTDFVETCIKMPDPHTRSLEPFSFQERPYLRRIYNTTSKRMLLMCGRQTEKCVVEDEPLLTASGRRVPIRDVRLGDDLACLETNEVRRGEECSAGARMTTSSVTWVSGRYRKPCVRLRTRQGHSTDVATTHPVRVWGGWRDAGDLRVGDRVAVVRRAGVFFDEEVQEARVRLTAFMIGDGSCAPKGLNFTNSSYAVIDDFVEALATEGMDYTFQCLRGKTLSIRMPEYKAQRLHDWLSEDGLVGKKSDSKFIPAWVFRLSRDQTALFLNRLWSTDGSVKHRTESLWDVEYCSMSRQLALDVQALLWKFGIPSRIRENWPSIYKKRGVRRMAYILRVETQDGVRAFVRDVGALDKIECRDLHQWTSNSNTDTYPPEVSQLVREVYAEVQPRKGDRTLRAAGIDRLPRGEHCLTRDKLRLFVDFFQADDRYDRAKVALLSEHLDADIYWDEVVSVEPLGSRWCRDLTVEAHHNYVTGALVTHNSTTLGNRLLAMSCLIPHFKTLYVSPSAAQTKEFSKTRIKETLDTCPDLRQWFPPHMTDNVFEKRAINRSAVTLRYAFLNADRCRGLSADQILMDEFQDLLLDVIPVIEEASSHSPYRYSVYSGTPKSVDNPIEHYWSTMSTQNEWAVPCERHGTPKVPGSWHWNVLGEANIGKTGLICDRCGGPISAAHPLAQWVRLGSPDPTLSVFEGFRIPQLMVPWIDWTSLLTKYNDYPRAMFFNECLGMSFDSGQRPLTREDVQNCCDDLQRMSAEGIKEWRTRLSGVPLYAGIDWGQDTNNSHTVFTLAGYYKGMLRTLFSYQFTGAESEPRIQMDKICKFIDAFEVERIGVDHGGGYWPNDELLRRYGSQRVVRFQYSQPGVFMTWDGNLGRYLLHRSEVMSAIFNAIKRGNVFRFPSWKDFATPFAADFLAIFSEYNERMHMTQYKKSPNNTDDSFHSFLLMVVVSMLDTPRPDIFVPSAATDRLLQGV